MKPWQSGLFRLSIWQATFLALLLLSACHKTHRITADDDPKLPRRVEGASEKELMRLQKKLGKCGIRVITIGSDYLVVVPSAVLFANQSPRLTWNAYGTLNTVVLFLKQFRKVAITVTSYSNKYVSPQREHALTLTRARAVGDYLWSQGVDSRLIFTVGAGSNKPIVVGARGGDRSPNSRIEITFRDALI